MSRSDRNEGSEGCMIDFLGLWSSKLLCASIEILRCKKSNFMNNLSKVAKMYLPEKARICTWSDMYEKFRIELD